MAGNRRRESLNEQGGSGEETSNSNEEYRLTGYNSLEQLRILYEIRVRENQQLNSVVLGLEAKVASQGSIMMQMTNICEEYDARHALSNERAAAVEEEAKAMKKKIEILENSNRSMSEQLTIFKMLTSDQQAELLLLHGRNGPDNSMLADSILQCAQQKHQKETMSLHDQLQTSADTVAQKSSDLEKMRRLLRDYEVSMAESREKMMNLQLEETGKTSADLKWKLGETNHKLQGLIEECQTKDEDILVLKNLLQGKELKLNAFKTRNLLFSKLVAAFTQDLKQLSLETLSTASADLATSKETKSYVAELKQSNPSWYKELMEYVQSQIPFEAGDPDIHIEVLRKRILDERTKKNTALAEISSAKKKMLTLVDELRITLADRDDYARQLSEQNERASVQHALFAATQAKVDILENQLKALLPTGPPDPLSMKEMRKSSQ